MDARAGELMGEYRQKANSMDRLLGAEDGRGRVRRRLDDFNQLIGIVIGLFNEVSADTLAMLEALADSRVDKVARSTGLGVADRSAERGLVIGQLRRELSTCTLRASMACLLDRVHQIGDNAALCNKRRERARHVEEQMRRERQAQWLSRTRDVHVLRKGHIFIT